ncbi:MAG: hypothetical protein A2046_12255 [Bacteroidetes bacterium GWA2_30_7]|nr:MAG: hypothetical protein A2046_12255 [Bacteroidetes bacterium GWA2_30_7]
MKKILSLIILISSFLYISAQNNPFTEQNKLTFKESESYKTVTFLVSHLETQQEINQLINLIKSNPDVFNVSFDNQTMTCTIECKIKMDKLTIVGITGTNGYKISEYEEKVHLFVSTSTAPKQERNNQQKTLSYNQNLYKVIFTIQNVNAGNKEQFLKDLEQINGVYKSDISPSNDKVRTFIQSNLNAERLKILLTQKGYLVSNFTEEAYNKDNNKKLQSPPIESISVNKEKKELTPTEKIEHLEQLINKRKAEGSDYQKYELEKERLKKEISK